MQNKTSIGIKILRYYVIFIVSLFIFNLIIDFYGIDLGKINFYIIYSGFTIFAVCIFCIFHCILRKDFVFTQKLMWVALLIIANWLACIIYLRDDIFYGEDIKKN